MTRWRERRVASVAARVAVFGRRFVSSTTHGVTDHRRAELEQARSEARFRVAALTAKLTVFNQDLDLRYTWIYEPQLGYRVDEVLGKTDAELLSVGGAEIMAAKRSAIQTGRAVRREVLAARGGESRWFHYTVEPLKDTSGAVVGITGAAVDITERKHVEEALRESEERCRTLADGSPVILWVTDAYGGNLFVNRTFREYFGVRIDEVEGGKWHPLIHPDDAAAYVTSFERAVAERRPFSGEGRGRRKDGAWRWIASHGEPRFSPTGEFLGHVGISNDITDHKLAESALRASETRFRILTSAAPVGIYQTDPSGRTVFHNPEWRRLTGLTATETLEEGWQRAIHTEDRERITGAWAAAVAAGQRFTGDCRLQSVAGKVTWVRGYGSPLRDGNGDPSGYIGVVADITEQRAVQGQVLAATRLASVGTLAAGVAHEINNPLSWLTANLMHAVERLSRKEAFEPDELRELLAEALQGAGRIADVVKAMRSLGRPETSEAAHDIDVRAELLSAIHMVRNQVVQRARLEFDVPEDLPLTRARRSELGRAFLALVVNAAQAIPEGRPAANRVAVTARSEAGEIIVDFADSGVGIAPAIRERIFEPFFTTRTLGVGTGLGLTIARTIIEEAGGRIELESQEGLGATFRVHLPAVAPAALAEPLPVPPAPGIWGTPRRVLIIDDEPLVGRSLRRFLGNAHVVTVLGSAEDALARIDAGERWDVILCDLMMPRMDGMAFYEAIASRDPSWLARIAFMTGGVFGERIERFLAAHTIPVVSKPFDRAEVLALLDRLGRS